MKNLAFQITATLTTAEHPAAIAPWQWKSAMLLRLATLTPDDCALIETWDDMDTEENATPADIASATLSLLPFDTDRTEDPNSPTNGMRADDGYAMMAATGKDQEDDCEITDAITNLLHLAHREEMDALQILSSALIHFTAETGTNDPSHRI